MVSNFSRSLLLKSSLLILTSASFAQVRFANVDSCYHTVFQEDSLSKYKNIFIAQFAFCSGSRYCGDRLVRYIMKRAAGNSPVLVMTSDTSMVYVRRLKKPNITVKYISQENLERYGVFSIYSLCINRKRRIKKLT